uniref:CUB domain-containing protein n=1 Tax=Romanomermis culicivorax TaxID=13658 RepID=A0A915K594_ROMCU
FAADHVVVHVNFLFTPAQDDNCSKLYLKIFDGPSSRDSPLRTTLCGSSSPPDLISTGDTFVVAL